MQVRLKRCLLSTDGKVVDDLREVDMTVIPNNQCKYYMNQGDIVSSSLCAGYLHGGKDTCQVRSNFQHQCRYYMNQGDIVSSSLCAGYLHGGKDACQVRCNFQPGVNIT